MAHEDLNEQADEEIRRLSRAEESNSKINQSNPMINSENSKIN
ncbi:hypothetical protein [Bacillus weihaiensis]|nr:hypothetical protein [Bacillus weihaiensis]